MDPLNALQSVLTKPFQFKGRATRPEFWWFFLLDLGLLSVLSTIDGYLLMLDQSWMADPLSISPLDFFSVWWGLIAFIPRISVTVRRLHDSNITGFVLLLWLIPLLGYLVTLALCAMPSDPQHNRHGAPDDIRRPDRSTGGAPDQRRDPVQAYAALFEMEAMSNPKYRESFEAKRKQEVRALYEQRVLGKPSQA